MLTLIIKDNVTDTEVLRVKTSLALNPKDSGAPFHLVEYKDLAARIKSGELEEGDVTAGLKDLNYSLTKGETFTIADIKVITDRNDYVIFLTEGPHIIAPNNLSYTTPNTFPRTVAITPLAPTKKGSPVVSYSVSPALPAGLVLNTTTGVISGTPTTTTATATYTVTATNTAGSTTKAVVITISA